MASFQGVKVSSSDRRDYCDEVLLQFLCGLDAFKSVSVVKLKRLVLGARVVRLRRRTETRFAGLFATHVYVLTQGAAKICLIDEDARPLLKTIIGAGDVFGGCSLFLPATVHGFLCVCLRDCILAGFDIDKLLDAFIGRPLREFAKLQGMVTERLWNQTLHHSGRADVGLRERLAIALLDLGARFGAQESRGNLLTLIVTHDMLADLVSASRQRITLHMNELVRCGAVKRDGRRLILVTPELQKIGGIKLAEPQPTPFTTDKDRINQRSWPDTEIGDVGDRLTARQGELGFGATVRGHAVTGRSSIARSSDRY